MGLGAIGKKLSTMAHGFGMTVLAYDPHGDSVYAARSDLTLVPFEKLLAESDVISLHLPRPKPPDTSSARGSSA